MESNSSDIQKQCQVRAFPCTAYCVTYTKAALFEFLIASLSKAQDSQNMAWETLRPEVRNWYFNDKRENQAFCHDVLEAYLEPDTVN
jgi:hypothetical protein